MIDRLTRFVAFAIIVAVLCSQYTVASLSVQPATPHWSAVNSSNNNIVIAKLLLQKGADVNAKANNGETALVMAKRNGFSKVMRLLKQAGANE